jgi:ribonuclease HII
MSTHQLVQPPDQYVIGSDECGYGAWAGPLMVCAFAAPVGWVPPKGLDDSKKLSRSQRAELYKHLEPLSRDFCCLVAVSSSAIDESGVGVALRHAHAYAIRDLQVRFQGAEVIIDGSLDFGLPGVRAVPRADGTYPVCMAASVIAKVNRDHIMAEYHRAYPGYDFSDNSGYGTGAHQMGLLKYGVCPIHRRSYRPIKKLLEAT